MLVLGIESSCDETGVALYDGQRGLLAHRLHSQVALHAEYGGVVPELASRDHLRRLVPLLRGVCAEAQVGFADIDGIAYTAGPGLIGALLVGAAAGRGVAYSLGKPAVAIHHMEGHLLAPMLEDSPPDFPFLALLVSGGHTLLVDVAGPGRYQVIGESLDDAAGEAFDKVASLLRLPYPGGPALAALATEGVAGRFRFPRPMLDRPGLDFSFSGLKTAAALAIARCGEAPDEATRAALARAFEDAVVEVLVVKCLRALDVTGHDMLVVSGGVGANRRLRQALAEAVQARGAEVRYPRIELCTDNGAMIAYAGWMRLSAGEFEPLVFGASARWNLADLRAPAAPA